MHLEVLILDDEELSREHVKDLVLEYAPDAITYLAESADEAANIIQEKPVDILFADIRMPGKNSFDLLRSVGDKVLDLVFITAYSEYAIQAIKEGATDYLLKPIKKTEFRDTFLKLIDKKHEQELKLSNTKFNVNDNYLNSKLSLNYQQGIKFITLKDIVYLEAQNSYTIVHLVNNEKITASKGINKFEAKLSQDVFFRIHKSYIINLFHFKEYISKDGDFAIMNNGERLYISRYRLNSFLNLLGNSSGTI